MKTFLRTLLYLALIVWLGAEIFFPITTIVVFETLMPNVSAAGTIVSQLIRILHGMGLISGVIALALLALAPSVHMYRPRAVLGPMILLVVMIALTVYSQFGIIPAMEHDRIAAGGTIGIGEAPSHIITDFDKLHNRSEFVEEAILLLGLATVVLVARAETARA